MPHIRLGEAESDDSDLGKERLEWILEKLFEG